MKVEELKQYILPIIHKYPIEKMGVFGSFARGTQSEDSDVDILVEINKKISLLTFVNIKLELEALLNRRVDLVEYESLKPRLKSRILSEEIRIYG